MSGLVVDLFAGGGGASAGIEAALGRPVDVAVNHCAAAVAMHAANHPATVHYKQDVWEVDPLEVCAGRPVDLLWASPDCTHFSRAKGAAPKRSKTRSLAWVVVRWAKAVRPAVIVLENVEEFATWGPLDEHGRPCPRRAGRTFRAWLGKLRAAGYAVEWRSLCAADFGAPTTRRRLYLVARRDGARVVWPEPTHGKGRARPWRAAAEVIDWSLPCPSIFGRKRPLAPATLRRIAEGLRRYVVEAAQPFVVKYHGGERGDARCQSIAEPLRTIDTANRFALVAPSVISHYGQSIGRAVSDPLPTITANGGGHHGVVAPTLVQTGYGERDGQAPRTLDLGKPLGTVVSGQKHALVAAFLAKHYGGVVGQGVQLPLGTITAQDHHSVVTATLAGGADRRAAVRAFLVGYYSNGGSQQQSLFDPLRTVTATARFGLVTVAGEPYEIADIGLRMLAPRELFAAQGFAPTHILDGLGLTKTALIRLAGNSVCPPVAEAIVRANCGALRRAEVA